jgi:hypothetical protein
MSWTYGNKKWTVPFKSLNGTDCHVDIYARGYTGSTVTTLTGAADPFEYEEDNDEDLLSHVIRYRTGYLRVIEENYADLSDLYPTLNTDRYIEFYYGSALNFNGFIQAQEFETPWGPGPRVVELPVISPLGLAEGTKMDWTAFNPPRWISIEFLINSILTQLEGMYDGFYFPKIISINDAITTNCFVNTLTFCPFGKKYNKDNTLDGIYEPNTAEEALTNICTWMGLILHDVPGYVVFQRVDYNDQYLKRRDVLAPFYTPTVTDLTQIATIASAENVESKVIPLTKIDVNFAGETDVPNMSFSRCRGYLRGCAVDDKEFCTNSPMIGDFTGTYTTYASVDSDGQIDKGFKCLGAYGSGGLQEMIMFRPADDWGSGEKVATYKFFEWNNTAMRLSLRLRFGESLEELTNPDDQTFAVIVKSGDYYWNSQQGRWLPVSGIGSNYSKNWVVHPEGDSTCEVGFTRNENLNKGEPLVVEMYCPTGNPDYVYTINDVSLKKDRSAASFYLNPNQDSTEYTINGTPSIKYGAVTRGYSTMIYTLNRIALNFSIISTGALEYEIADAEPQYPYLLEAQDRIQIDMKMTNPDMVMLYLNRITLWGTAGKWRTIACSFKPWNDNYQLTLHHSSIFD